MPELPEVQYFTDLFNDKALNKTIKNITCKTDKLIKEISVTNFKKVLIGKKFSKAVRRGKFTIADIKDDQHKLVIHYSMTGSLEYKKLGNFDEQDKKFTQVTFEFDNGYALLWLDKRKFGAIYLVSSVDKVDTLKNMGPEPLKLTESQFLKLLDEHGGQNIKAFLMDQSNIAGIGNNYSNELLFQTGIDPHRGINDLSPKEKKELYKKLEDILKKAIKIDAAKQNYPNSWLLAHKKNMVCPNNKNHKLVKTKIAGRSAIYCPVDQK